jgi:hypothetical protein
VAYFPVPTIKRLEKVCDPIRNGSGAKGAVDMALSSSNERNDFQPVSVPQPVLGVPRSGDQFQVHLDGDELARQPQLLEQLGHGNRGRQAVGLTVDDDFHRDLSSRSRTPDVFRTVDDRALGG